MSTNKLASLTGSFVLALHFAAAAPAARAKPDFPVTLKTTAGTITLTSRPTRIVSLSSTGTEDLFSDGAGSQVIGLLPI